MATDPLTTVYDAMWGLLEASADFCAVVKEGNRIAYTGRFRDPNKQTIQDADLPEVRLVASTIGESGVRDTGGVGLKLGLEFQVSTGDRRLDYRLFPVVWAIYRAMSKWQATLTALTWEEATFVLRPLFGSGSIGVSNVDLKRNLDGWAAVWACEIEMFFAHTDLQGA